MRSVRLDDELEKRLNEASRITAEPVSQIIRDAVRERCDELLGTRLLERIADVIGTVASRGRGRESRRTGEAFTHILMRRDRRRK